MPNALIYSPDFDGHRQVYVFVLAEILMEKDFKIFIAGNTQKVLLNSFYIDQLKKNTEISFIDTSKFSDGGLGINSSDFLELQNKCGCDLTVFAEADNHISLLNSQISGKKRFKGKLAGIFLRPFYYYEKLGFLDKLRYLKHFHERWRKDDRMFHEFLLKRYSLLDIAFYIDENYVDHHKSSTWLPDVFQEYADLILKDEKSEQRIWIERLESFKEKNKGRFPLLYFGTGQFRRGYDTLLKLAVDSGGCFIHCGLNNRTEKYVLDTDELKSLLKKEGRLFETNQFIEDPYCIEYFFKSVSHLILPYRNFYGSSGVMLQALSYGIPVLAPENGIIGYRIKKYQMGRTYNDINGNSLEFQFERFKNISSETFKNNIKNYMNYQTAEQLRKTLINSFSFSKEIVKHP
jgi:hypothetical protein